ncbi:hypothetical protein D9M71_550570 [compost metagenome]
MDHRFQTGTGMHDQHHSQVACRLEHWVPGRVVVARDARAGYRRQHGGGKALGRKPFQFGDSIGEVANWQDCATHKTVQVALEELIIPIVVELAGGVFGFDIFQRISPQPETGEAYFGVDAVFFHILQTAFQVMQADTLATPDIGDIQAHLENHFIVGTGDQGVALLFRPNRMASQRRRQALNKQVVGLKHM